MIILVGGAFTPDGGDLIDSRQQLVGDNGSDAMRRSLGGSWLWWSTVASVVVPMLESSGREAYALVIGERSVHELKPDGSTARESLRKLLPGGSGDVAFVPRARAESVGTEASAEGVSRYELAPDQPVRWRFIDGDDPDLERFPISTSPTVIVDTSEAIYEDRMAPRLDKRERLRRRFATAVPPCLVLPHTAATEGVVTAFLTWRAKGSPPLPEVERPVTGPDWLDTPPDPMAFTQMVPVSADFRVTGLVRHGDWTTPDDLEAARRLLQARYDLRIGIWDLVDNAVLRQSLLEATPVAPAPPEQVSVPRGADARARAAVEKKVAQQERLREIYAVADPLTALGWVPEQLEPYSLLSLPLGGLLKLGSSTRPTAWMSVCLTRHEARVIARVTIGMRGLMLGEYVEQHRQQFEDIAGTEVAVSGGLMTLWKAPGGWADDVEWVDRFRELATKSERWLAALAPFVDALHRALGRLRA